MGDHGKVVRTRRQLLITGAAAVAQLALPAVVRAGDGAPFRFGLTPVFRSDDLQLLATMRRYFELSLKRPVRLVTRRTYQEITGLLLSDQLDAAWICGYPFVQHRDQLSLIAVPLWNGKPLYQSYVIADKERKVDGIEDLRGDIHAFSDPNSNSGFLVTSAWMARHRRRAETFFSKTFFTYAHRNVIRAVGSGLANSGSVDGYVWEVVNQTEPDLTASTQVVRKSKWFGFPPIVCPISRAGEKAIDAFGEILVKASGDAAGKEMLAMLRLDGFAVEPPKLFDDIAANMELVRAYG